MYVTTVYVASSIQRRLPFNRTCSLVFCQFTWYCDLVRNHSSISAVNFLNSVPQHTFRPHDPVAFNGEQGEECGYIASVKGRKALVVVKDGREFRVPVDMLKLRSGVKPRRVHSRNDAARMAFKEDDHVSFVDSQQVRHEGHIVKINPKYARVRSNDLMWQVPYVNLERTRSSGSSEDKRSQLLEIEAQAEMLLKKHGLGDWRFGFDQASRRGGRCAFDQREISLSEQFATAASRAEVTDTILHEIAHALVGSKHGHDAVWKATARRIGCSGRVTHDVDFSSARWILTCTTCGWRVPRMRRRKGLVCKDCGQGVVFQRTDGSESSSASI